MSDDKRKGANELITEYISNDSGLFDPNQTLEQRMRDKEITKLLKQYVLAYRNKVDTQRHYRKVVLIMCIVIVSLFAVALLVVIGYYGFIKTDTDISNVVSLISICLTFSASIFGLINTITKYCFPENDEQYITDIVSAIQTNDLQHKIANINFIVRQQTPFEEDIDHDDKSDKKDDNVIEGEKK